MAGVKLTGDWKSFESMIGKTITKMRHTQTLTEAIGETLVASTKERFENEERPDGTKWDKSIRAQAEGGQTLTDRVPSDMKHLPNRWLWAQWKFTAQYINSGARPEEAGRLRFPKGPFWGSAKTTGTKLRVLSRISWLRD